MREGDETETEYRFVTTFVDGLPIFVNFSFQPNEKLHFLLKPTEGVKRKKTYNEADVVVNIVGTKELKSIEATVPTPKAKVGASVGPIRLGGAPSHSRKMAGDHRGRCLAFDQAYLEGTIK